MKHMGYWNRKGIKNHRWSWLKMSVWNKLFKHRIYWLKMCSWFGFRLYDSSKIFQCVFMAFVSLCCCCCCLGWSNNYVSKWKYHFLIPTDSSWNKPLDESVFDVQSHLLHGLIHCNGLGHLLCINGIEGGSKYLLGREIMDLWDRICTTLQAR